MSKQFEYIQPLQKEAPLLLGGHPISYTTKPTGSILDPYNNNDLFFPTILMKNSIYKHYGGGYYATQFAQQSDFRRSDFQIGVKLNWL